MTTIKEEYIAGYKCHVYIENSDAPYIYWAMQMHQHDDVENMIKRIKTLLNHSENTCSFNLIAFEANNWNSDFSIWEAPAVFGMESFSGEGQSTYEWLMNECIPIIESEADAKQKPVRLIAGYSLAGLFALWSFYKGNLFTGAASCSGSLWYPGWIPYLKSAKTPEHALIYLSLGIKEEQTKNKVMALVGDATRETFEIMEKDLDIQETVLEWNNGGHFNNPAERTAKGIAWLLERAL